MISTKWLVTQDRKVEDSFEFGEMFIMVCVIVIAMLTSQYM